MPTKTIPQHVRDDSALLARFRVKLTEAAGSRLDEGEWSKFLAIHQLDERVGPRFMQSVKWGNEDRDALILKLITWLVEHGRDEALLDLYERDTVQRWFKQNDREFLDAWQGKKDPLLEALGHSFAEVDEVKDVIDLSQYTQRLRSALPGDPQLAVGTTKDLLEATMRTILRRRGHEKLEELDFPTLTTRCLTELGLLGTAEPSTARERALRKIASRARDMINTANELRNAAGSGHGKVIGEEEDLGPEDASLVASSGLILAAWLARHSNDSE